MNIEQWNTLLDARIVLTELMEKLRKEAITNTESMTPTEGIASLWAKASEAWDLLESLMDNIKVEK